MKPTIGVMGWGGTLPESVDSERILALAEQLGQIIAEKNCILITGTTNGTPDCVARAVIRCHGFTVGISPADSLAEHVSKYQLPIDSADLIIYTGFGYKGRNVINIRSSDIVIIFGGGIGTINEFTIAFDEGKIIGVLEGVGGAADTIQELMRLSHRTTGATVLTSPDPSQLIQQCLGALTSREQVMGSGLEA
jgi:uncharacterized protein (TIGR00725 family)